MLLPFHSEISSVLKPLKFPIQVILSLAEKGKCKPVGEHCCMKMGSRWQMHSLCRDAEALESVLGHPLLFQERVAE